jgi:LD-carboxypeptidase C-terminal domain
MTRSLLGQIVANQPPLGRLPVLANIDFGHTYPLATLPIGGTIALTVAGNSNLTITEHGRRGAIRARAMISSGPMKALEFRCARSTAAASSACRRGH